MTVKAKPSKTAARVSMLLFGLPLSMGTATCPKGMGPCFDYPRTFLLPSRVDNLGQLQCFLHQAFGHFESPGDVLWIFGVKLWGK